MVILEEPSKTGRQQQHDDPETGKPAEKVDLRNALHDHQSDPRRCTKQRCLCQTDIFADDEEQQAKDDVHANRNAVRLQLVEIIGRILLAIIAFGNQHLARPFRHFDFLSGVAFVHQFAIDADRDGNAPPVEISGFNLDLLAAWQLRPDLVVASGFGALHGRIIPAMLYAGDRQQAERTLETGPEIKLARQAINFKFAAIGPDAQPRIGWTHL